MASSGGKLARQDTAESIIRDLLTRVGKLERLIGQVLSDAPLPGPTSLYTPLVFNITTPTTTWNIVHGRGRYVAVQFFDNTGTEVNLQVVCTNLNTVQLSSSSAFAGTAIVI